MARQHRDVEEIRIMERATKVRQYRLIGFTQREIAEKLEISIDTVRRDIERIKVDFPQQAVAELIVEQDEKVREMMKPHIIRALKGDIKATDMTLKLLDHQAKLFGLYNAQTDDTGMDLAMQQFNRLVQAIESKGSNDYPGDH